MQLQPLAEEFAWTSFHLNTVFEKRGPRNIPRVAGQRFFCLPASPNDTSAATEGSVALLQFRWLFLQVQSTQLFSHDLSSNGHILYGSEPWFC